MWLFYIWSNWVHRPFKGFKSRNYLALLYNSFFILVASTKTISIGQLRQYQMICWWTREKKATNPSVSQPASQPASRLAGNKDLYSTHTQISSIINCFLCKRVLKKKSQLTKLNGLKHGTHVSARLFWLDPSIPVSFHLHTNKPCSINANLWISNNPQKHLCYTCIRKSISNGKKKILILKIRFFCCC